MVMYRANRVLKRAPGIKLDMRAALYPAIAILARYGGSLWVSDPAYTFTGSDGTGAAGDGSDAGYVRDLCGNARPLTQATTGFKPKLKRVPKKLGPELVTNGAFDNDISGWYRAGTTTDGSIGWSAGKLQCVRLTADAMAQTTMSGLLTGKQYQVSVTGAGAGFTVGSIDASVRNFSDGAVALFTVTATSQNLRVWPTNTNSTVLFDNISVREVLEWTWAWVFDGVDDGLATVAQPTASSETIIAVSQRGPSRATESKYVIARVSSADVSTGSAIYQGASDVRPYGLCVGNIYGPHSDQPVHVISAVAAPTSFKVRQSGVQVGAGSLGVYTSNANPISIGKAVNAARYFNAGVLAAAYAPAAIPDAELLIVERAMAQLAGVTI